MFDLNTEVLEATLSLAVAILCLCLSRYRLQRNKEYAKKYAANTSLLLLRLLITWSLKLVGIVMLLGLIWKCLSPFIAFYIFTPVLIASNLVLFDGTDWMWGFMTFVKGLYYLGLFMISAIQLFLGREDIALLAIGFTLSLSVFEGITALSDGYKKMHEAKQVFKDN